MASPHSGLTGTNLHVPFHYIQDADPGAVGAGKFWLDTNSGPPLKLYRRNAGDAGWDEIGPTSTGAALTVQEIDGTPSDTAVTNIKFPNGSVTDNGVGDVTIGVPVHAHANAASGDALQSSTINDPQINTAFLTEPTIDDFLDYTEGAAPGTPPAGTVRTYAKADGLLYQKDDAGLEKLLAGAVEHDYVERTSNLTITATTAAGADSFITGNAVAYDGATRVRIEFSCALFDMVAGATVTAQLYDGATDLGSIARMNELGGAVCVARYLTPSNASHTYSIRLWESGGGGSGIAGAGGAGTFMPAFLRITTA